MPVSDLPTNYHQQDTDYYCGAACAQMVLDAIGSGLLDQDTLYAENHSHGVLDPTISWATPPDGLQWTLNHNLPPTPSPVSGFPYYFALDAFPSEDQISRMIVWTIYHWKVAPIALVYGMGHWIVVRGYDTSANPASYSDNTYTINGFYVNNPWPPVPSFYAPPAPPPPAPPPHANGTDGCGTGGNRGVADEHLSYATWKSTYMTGVGSGHWSGLFVAICDPSAPAPRGGNQFVPRRPAPGNVLLQREQVAELAMAGLKEYRLTENRRWAEVFQTAKPAQPVLVQRLDRPDSYYYLQPYESAANELAAIASIDAKFGSYRQAVALPAHTPNLFATFPAEAAKKAILGQHVNLGSQLGRILLREGTFCFYPAMVWQPCLESLSPYYPFYMLTAGGLHLYVRIDGRIFPRLTTNIFGI